MARSTTARRAPPPGASAFTGLAFSTWAAALAIGVLVHEWQFIQAPYAYNTLIVGAAFAVILRPSAVWRTMLLLALLAAELVVVLPNPQNHIMFIGLVGATIVAWWLWLRWRAPARAADPTVMYARLGPYLRVGFILVWYAAALAKINTGFEDTGATCSVWILQSIPAVHAPEAGIPLVVMGARAVELAVPTLLIFHRTRWLGIILGFGFHVVSALAGHSPFSGFAWSFYLLFLPPIVIARAVVLGRRSLPGAARRAIAWLTTHAPVAIVTFMVLWAVAATLLTIASDEPWPPRRWGAALLCLTWMGWTGWLLVRLRRHWLPPSLTTAPPGPRASLQVRNGLFALGLVALLFTAAMPYLGLKTRASFTMYANLRTEPGHWNHRLIPESVRVFDWQDGDVRFLTTDDPRLQEKIDGEAAAHTVLLGARLLVDDHRDARVVYELDGVRRVAAPVAADPVLGDRPSLAQRWFGAMRPFVEGNTCQH